MSSEIADPYRVLGISRTADADELKRAYRRLSKAWHPDRHATAPESERSDADRRFKLINSAYVAVGEILRTKVEAETATAQAIVNERSDTRAEAVKSVVASAALRIIPNVPRHTYRRIVSLVEGILLDTLAVGERAFEGGFEATVRDAMDFAGLGKDSRDDAMRVLDAAADDLQWRGKGADPATWEALLRPLEQAMRPSAGTRPTTAVRSTNAASQPFIRPEPGLRATQAALGLFFLLLLVPIFPVVSLIRVALLVGSIIGFGYVTYWIPRT
jgi:DnaJ-domain-containing protein 1